MSTIDVKAMFEGMRSQLQSDEADGKLAGLTLELLEEAVSHPEAADRITEFMEIEAQSVQAGDPAPDFTLPWLGETGENRSPALTLSEHFGKRPVALIFGSYT